MHRIDTSTAQRDKFGEGKNGFTRGNPQTGTPATQLDFLYCDAIQEEIANTIEYAGIKLDKSKHDQLATAIKELIGRSSVKLNSSTTSELETEAATPLAVKKAYDLANGAVKKTGDTMTGQLILSEFGIKHRYTDSENLIVLRTIGDNYSCMFYDAEKKQWQSKLVYSSSTNSWNFPSIDDVKINNKSLLNNYIPIGVPMPWPQTAPPEGWLECNGSTFDKNKFPKLAVAYPAGKLPDLRGEFIRGWDNGKGTDSNRGVLSWQNDAIRNIYGEISPISETFGAAHVATGAFQYFEKHSDHTPTSIDRGLAGGVTFDASRIVPTANENRPRNVAFMYIVKAE